MTCVSCRHHFQTSWAMKPKSNAYSHNPDKEKSLYSLSVDANTFQGLMQTLFKGVMFCMKQIMNKWPFCWKCLSCILLHCFKFVPKEMNLNNFWSDFLSKHSYFCPLSFSDEGSPVLRAREY